MPAVLIETAYITNKEDYQRLTTDEFRAATAKGIADGIMAALQEVGAFDHNGELYVFKEAESE
jgi:N-acetylmuramoyl-L-alanine amidase